MEFFNKKEEVIDIKLTQFGRYLLSKGELKPAFYSFHDDNIIYDVQKTGLTEVQKESEARIESTPTMHHQISISSLEKEFNNNYNKIVSQSRSKGARIQSSSHLCLNSLAKHSSFLLFAGRLARMR